MNVPIDQLNLFREKAETASAVVRSVAGMDEAFSYAVDLCRSRAAKKHAEPAHSASADAQPTIAAPALSATDRPVLQDLCRTAGIRMVGDGLRDNLNGVDIGLTAADFGIAETGTLVINSTGEDLRLATMVSDIHLAVLPVSRIRDNSGSIADELRTMMADPRNYTAFITGPSRTADIERVLAIGVHGPLELHILLLEDEACQA